MNAIVLVALRKPLTFVVMSLLILLFGGLAVVAYPHRHFSEYRHPGGGRGVDL